MFGFDEPLRPADVVIGCGIVPWVTGCPVSFKCLGLHRLHHIDGSKFSKVVACVARPDL